MLLWVMLRVHGRGASRPPHSVSGNIVVLLGRWSLRMTQVRSVRAHRRLHGAVTRRGGRGVSRGVVVPLDRVGVEIPNFLGGRGSV